MVSESDALLCEYLPLFFLCFFFCFFFLFFFLGATPSSLSSSELTSLLTLGVNEEERKSLIWQIFRAGCSSWHNPKEVCVSFCDWTGQRWISKEEPTHFTVQWSELWFFYLGSFLFCSSLVFSRNRPWRESASPVWKLLFFSQSNSENESRQDIISR